MPHMPDSHHATHDLELVAAYAAGDAAGADLETATALVAACADCAALHRDLRAITAAIPELPAPVRTRDFRLTQEQAATLRPTGLRGLLAAFASPRLSFATPLGTGLAALGIVGILVASGGLPLGAGGAASGTAQRDAEDTATGPALEAPAGVGAAASEAPAEMGPAAASQAPMTGLADPSQVLKSETDGGVTGSQPEAMPGPDTGTAPDPLLVFGVVFVFAGTALVALRLVARRLARAP
jgi:hypothetical protein